MAPTSNKLSPVTKEDVETIISYAMGSDFEVLHYELKPFSKLKTGNLGTHLSLTVEVQRKSQSESDKVENKKFFVKIQPDSPVLKDLLMDDNTFPEEVHFYSKIYPLIMENCTGEKWLPRCFLSKYDVLVYEDLQIQGYVLRENSHFNEESLRLALTALARFHAASFTLEEKLGKKLNDVFPKAFVEKMYCKSNKFGKNILVGYKTIILLAEKFGLDAALVPKIYDKVYESVRARDGECNVICHGDLWKNNLLFNDGEKKCVLVDFQFLRYASVAIDIGMLLYLHTTPEDRKRLEYSLLKHYYSVLYDTLAQNTKLLVKIPTYENILKDYNKHRLVGMTYASLYSPGIHLDPEDLSDIMNDLEKLEKWYFKERIDFITVGMNKNPVYEKLLKDTITETFSEANRVFSQ